MRKTYRLNLQHPWLSREFTRDIEAENSQDAINQYKASEEYINGPDCTFGDVTEKTNQNYSPFEDSPEYHEKFV